MSALFPSGQSASLATIAFQEVILGPGITGIRATIRVKDLHSAQHISSRIPEDGLEFEIAFPNENAPVQTSVISYQEYEAIEDARRTYAHAAGGKAPNAFEAAEEAYYRNGGQRNFSSIWPSYQPRIDSKQEESSAPTSSVMITVTLLVLILTLAAFRYMFSNPLSIVEVKKQPTRQGSTASSIKSAHSLSSSASASSGRSEGSDRSMESIERTSTPDLPVPDFEEPRECM